MTCRHNLEWSDCTDCQIEASRSRKAQALPHDDRRRRHETAGERTHIVAACPEPLPSGARWFVVRAGTERVRLERCVCGASLATPFVIEEGAPSPEQKKILEHRRAEART